MRIEDLRYLIQVADCKSISAAAEKCFISQQGLSRIINSLESELGVQLFHRQNGHIYLTAVGEVAVSWARELDHMQQQMLRDISNANRIEAGFPPVDYHIYTSQLISETSLGKILSVMNLRFPGINLDIIEEIPPVIANEVEFGPNTIAITSISNFHEAQSERLSNGALVFEKYYTDELMIGVSSQSSLCKKDLLTSKELQSIPIALCQTEGMMFQNLLEDGDLPTIALHISSYSLCREMVFRGRAAGLTSDYRNYYSEVSVASIPVEKKINVSYGIIYDPNCPRTPFVEELFEVVKKEFSSIPKH